MYLNLYQPRLQHEMGVVGFFKFHRGFPFVSSALMDPISKTFVADIHRFVADHGVELVDFRPGQRDDVAQEFLAGFDGNEGCAVRGPGAGEDLSGVVRTEKCINPATGKAYPWLVRRTAIVNHFYIYAVDDDFGPFFIKFCTYFPYNAKVCLNGNEWAKRQAAKAGIQFEPLDNGFASCDDPKRLQRIWDQLDATKIDRFVCKWLACRPHPFTAADRRAGYRYDLSILQAEFSLTQTLDRPLAGGCSSKRSSARTSTSAGNAAVEDQRDPVAVVREAQEVERFRLPVASCLPVAGGVPPELDETRLVGMQFQVELREAFAKVSEKLVCVALMLAASARTDSSGSSARPSRNGCGPRSARSTSS